MRMKFVFLGLLGIITCAFIFFLFRPCDISPAELKRPLSVSEVRAMPDGGSLEINLVGADGRMLRVTREGSLAIASSNQKMRISEYRWFLPLSCDVPKGSSLEAEVKDALKHWLSTRLSADQQEKLLRNDQDALRSTPYDMVVAFDLMSWIDRRH